MPCFSAVLFDLDGTLLDSEELILESYQHTLQEHGVAVPPTAVLRSGVGQPLEELFVQWVDDVGEIPRMVTTFRKHNLAIHDDRVSAFPGVNEIVHELHARGTKLAIVTSKSRIGTKRGLGVLGLEDHFEVRVCWDDVERPKPHPEPVRIALEALGGVDPSEAIFVGDSTHDIHAGNAAGVHTAAVAWGIGDRAELTRAQPRSWVEGVEDLERLLLGPA